MGRTIWQGVLGKLMRCTTWWCVIVALSGVVACFGEQVVSTSNSSKPSNLSTTPNQTSVICNDNSTGCKRWHAEQKVKRRQMRAAMSERDTPEATGKHMPEAHVSIDSPDKGPKPKSSTEKTTARDVVLTLDLNFDWPKANEKAFKAAVIADLTRALELDNATVQVSGIFLDTVTNGTKIIVSVKGDDNVAALENLTNPTDAKNLSFTSVANASQAKGKVKLSGLQMTPPTSVLTSEAVKLNAANFKKELVKRPGYDKLPQLHGMDTTPRELLERAAKIEDLDPSKDVQDGKSKHERKIAAIVGELLGLLGAEVTKKTKSNANAMQQLVLGKHAKGPEFKKRLAGLGKELGNMLRPEL